MSNSTPRAALPPLPVGVAWTLTETLTRKETTTRGYLWFTNPINCCWTALYTAEQMQERDRQIVQSCAEAAKQCRSGLGAEAAILALLLKEPQA